MAERIKEEHRVGVNGKRNGHASSKRKRVFNYQKFYSDLMLHDMGPGLADGVSQGQAGPRDFRTAPLWGVGQRIFFLHDGRTSDLLIAIQEHASGSTRTNNASEANLVVANFNNLRENQKQDVLNFLRSR